MKIINFHHTTLNLWTLEPWTSCMKLHESKKRTAEPQNIEYRMSKGGFASLSLSEKVMSDEWWGLSMGLFSPPVFALTQSSVLVTQSLWVSVLRYSIFAFSEFLFRLDRSFFLAGGWAEPCVWGRSRRRSPKPWTLNLEPWTLEPWTFEPLNLWTLLNPNISSWFLLWET